MHRQRCRLERVQYGDQLPRFHRIGHLVMQQSCIADAGLHCIDCGLSASHRQACMRACRIASREVRQWNIQRNRRQFGQVARMFRHTMALQQRGAGYQQRTHGAEQGSDEGAVGQGADPHRDIGGAGAQIDVAVEQLQMDVDSLVFA
nr:hypothetical protein [Lysobacter sp.]